MTFWHSLSAPRLISFQAEPHAVHNSSGWWMRSSYSRFSALGDANKLEHKKLIHFFFPSHYHWRKHCVTPSLVHTFREYIEHDGTSHRYWFMLAPHSSRTSYIIARKKKKLFYELFRPSHTELFVRYISSHPVYTPWKKSPRISLCCNESFFKCRNS